MYPPVEASCGQKQYYIRSPLHFSAHLIFSLCRGKLYIGIFLGDLSSWTLSNLCRFICCIVVVVVTVSFCCCCSSVIVDPQLQINNNKITQWTTRRIRWKRLNNLCRLIFCLLFVVVVTQQFCCCWSVIVEAQRQMNNNNNNYILTTITWKKRSI